MLKKLGLLLVATLIASAILTPPVYTLLELLFGNVPWPFSRVYDRVVLVVLIVFLAIYRKQFNVRETLSFLKADNKKRSAKIFLLGLIITLVPVFFVIPLSVESGFLTWNIRDTDYYTYRLSKLIPTILIVSFLEEIIFRGFIFVQLKKTMSSVKAMILGSVIYSLAHFVAPVKTFKYESFDIFAGFEYYGVVLGRFVDFNLVIQFLLLLIIGIFLCYVLTKTNCIFLCAGLHGGWIASIKLAKFTSNVSPDVYSLSSLAERYFLLELPLTWLGVLISILITIYLIKKKAKCLEN